jgi:hypothetical protein
MFSAARWTRCSWAPTNDHLVVLDWKDTWAIPGPASISAEGYFQQRAYAYLLLMQPEHDHLDAVTLREVYVRFRAGRVGHGQRARRRPSPVAAADDRQELAVIVEAFDEALQHGEERPVLWRNPSPGGHCNYCPLPHNCPVWDSYEELRKMRRRCSRRRRRRRPRALLIVAKRVVKLMEATREGVRGVSRGRVRWCRCAWIRARPARTATRTR